MIWVHFVFAKAFGEVIQTDGQRSNDAVINKNARQQYLTEPYPKKAAEKK